MNRFLNHDNPDKVFTTTQRHLVCNEILANAAYGSKKKAQVGAERLINEGIYCAAFPLHEVFNLFENS